MQTDLSCYKRVFFLGLCQTSPFIFTAIDFCASTPCKHNGSCHNDANSFRCSCTSGYGGKSCETSECSWSYFMGWLALWKKSCMHSRVHVYVQYIHGNVPLKWCGPELFHCNVPNSTIRMYTSRAFIWVITPLGCVWQFWILSESLEFSQISPWVWKM